MMRVKDGRFTVLWIIAVSRGMLLFIAWPLDYFSPCLLETAG